MVKYLNELSEVAGKRQEDQREAGKKAIWDLAFRRIKVWHSLVVIRGEHETIHLARIWNFFLQAKYVFGSKIGVTEKNELPEKQP